MIPTEEADDLTETLTTALAEPDPSGKNHHLRLALRTLLEHAEIDPAEIPPLRIRIGRGESGDWHALGISSCSQVSSVAIAERKIVEFDIATGDWRFENGAGCDRCAEMLSDRYALDPSR